MYKFLRTIVQVGALALLSACPNIAPNPKPTISIGSPLNGSSVTTTSIVVSGSASDDKGVAKIEYTVNGSARATANGTNNWNFTANNLIVGNNSITVFASDAENAETSATVNVTLNTTPTNFSLTVAKAGTGTGTVTSAPSGINCGSSCSLDFTSGTNVTLTATPSTGSSFAGWSGACSGGSTCQVTMNQAQSAIATFALIPPPADTTPPTVSISSPANNATVQTATVNVTGTASDNVGVSFVQVSVNSTARVSATGIGTWSYTAALNCGANTIVAIAKDAVNLEGSSSVTVTRDCGSFALAPVYPSGQTSYPVAQGSDVLYTLTLTPTTPFNTAANALSSLTATGTNIGTGANQMRVFYQPTLSSGNQVGVVFKAGSSLPLGLQTVTLQASAGGVSASVMVNVNILSCTSGC
jgi:hypothetical protein